MKLKPWYCLHRWVEINIYGSEYIQRKFIIMLTERGNSIVCEIISKCVLLNVQILKCFEKLSNQNLRVIISDRVIPSADYDRSETTGDCIAHVFLCSFGPSILFSFYFVMFNIALYNKFEGEQCYSLVAAYLCAAYAAPNSNNRYMLIVTNKLQHNTIFFIVVKALHVSGGFPTHHHELKNYMQHLVFVPSQPR
jgi:hypothetical protein